jgi:hypothetical protein
MAMGKYASHQKIDPRVAKFIGFFKKKMFGRWCDSFDNQGKDCSRELDYDRDHYRKQDGFHEMFGRRDFNKIYVLIPKFD